ncbi:MAG: VanZ family protein, partial [Clostridia bacterium]|nr:VanZ family protein [Clostridia bacterium]
KKLSLYHLGALAFVIAMTAVFSLTGVSPISGFHTDIRLDSISFIPFAGIIDMLKGGIDLYTVINIMGNIIMFMPLGFCLSPLTAGKIRFGKTVMWGFMISLLIECSQLFLCRGTDVDDLILNTIGAICGYGVYVLFRKLLPGMDKMIRKEANFSNNGLLPLLGTIIPYVVIVILGFYDRSLFFGG